MQNKRYTPLHQLKSIEKKKRPLTVSVRKNSHNENFSLSRSSRDKSSARSYTHNIHPKINRWVHNTQFKTNVQFAILPFIFPVFSSLLNLIWLKVSTGETDSISQFTIKILTFMDI